MSEVTASKITREACEVGGQPLAEEGEHIPSPGNPMAVARHITTADMTEQGRFTLRSYGGSWMRWDGPHWSEVTTDAIRARLYPALEHATYLHMTKKGELEVHDWAPNKKKISDLMEAIAAVTYLPEETEVPSFLRGPGHGPVGPGMDRVEVETSPQVNRVGPGGPGNFENYVTGMSVNGSQDAEQYREQRQIHPVHPVQGSVNGFSPAQTVDRVPGPDARSVIACANGLLDVHTRRLSKLTPAFFNRVSVPFPYHDDAPPPKRWLDFLADIWGEDSEAIETLQEWAGYILSGRTDQQKILYVVGPPRSGKGTIGRILTTLIGAQNTASTTPSALPTDFGLEALLGKSLAIMADARTSTQGNEALVERLLTISGEDAVPVKRKYREDWMGRLPVRFVLMSNDLPAFRDPSGAIASRLLILRMTKSNLGKENHGLFDELVAEMPGILNWALDGLTRLLQRGSFKMPGSSADAVITINASVSPIKEFLDDRCALVPTEQIPVQDLFDEWRDWCEKNGHVPGSKANFGKLLFSAAPSISQTRPYVEENGVKTKVRMYAGIRLRLPSDDEPDAPVCTVCNTPMKDLGDGETTHPNCGPATA